MESWRYGCGCGCCRFISRECLCENADRLEGLEDAHYSDDGADDAAVGAAGDAGGGGWFGEDATVAWASGAGAIGAGG